MSTPLQRARAKARMVREEREIIARLGNALVSGLLLAASPARDRLKRRGWIKSMSRPGGRYQSRGAKWCLTDAGIAELKDLLDRRLETPA